MPTIVDGYVADAGLNGAGLVVVERDDGIVFEYYTGEIGADRVSLLAPTANPNLEGGADVDPPDYAALLLLHLRGGRCGDEQVLSQDALDRLHADRVAAVYDGDAGGPGNGYGMGWWIDRTTGRLSDPGLYGAVPWLDLDDGFGAYLVVEATGQDGGALAALLFEPVEAAVLAAR